jgi:hypothetical protein
MRKQQDRFSRDPGGFRAAWLIFLEAYTFNVIIFLGIRYTWASTLLVIPFLAIVIKVCSVDKSPYPFAQPFGRYDTQAFIDALDKATDENTPLPDIKDFYIPPQENEQFDVVNERLEKSLENIPIRV